MKRLTIGGQPKDSDEYCMTCHNGEKFKDDLRKPSAEWIKDNEKAPRHNEIICDVCHTKYRMNW